jgi:hypothetical protein
MSQGLKVLFCDVFFPTAYPVQIFTSRSEPSQHLALSCHPTFPLGVVPLSSLRIESKCEVLLDGTVRSRGS